MNPIQHSFQTLEPSENFNQRVLDAASQKPRHKMVRRTALIAAVVACLAISVAAVSIGVSIFGIRDVEVNGTLFHEVEIAMDLEQKTVRQAALEQLNGIWTYFNRSDDYMTLRLPANLPRFSTLEETEAFLGIDLLRSDAIDEQVKYITVFPEFPTNQATDPSLEGTTVAPDQLVVQVHLSNRHGVLIFIALSQDASNDFTVAAGSAEPDGTWLSEQVRIDDTFSGILLAQNDADLESRERSAAYLMLSHDGVGYEFWYSSYEYEDPTEARRMVLSLAENLK